MLKIRPNLDSSKGSKLKRTCLLLGGYSPKEPKEGKLYAISKQIVNTRNPTKMSTSI